MAVVRISNSWACGWPTLTWDETQVSGKAWEQLDRCVDADRVNYCVSYSVVTPGSQAPVGLQLSLVSVLQTGNSVGSFLFPLLVSPAPSLQPPIQTEQTQPFANTPGSRQNRPRSLGCGNVSHGSLQQVRPRVCCICLGEHEISLRA